MTILSAVRKTESDNDPPPPYVDLLQQDAPPPPSPIAPRAQSTNFLNDSRTNNAIRGTYVVDPSIPVPLSVPPPKDADGRPLNLRLNSTNGSIDAVATILRAPEVKGPVRLEMTSTNGKVKAYIEDERQQHFHLRAASTNGRIQLRLPQTFSGPISTKQRNGPLLFSPAMQARLTTFSKNGKERRFFLGDYRASGYVDDGSWFGDSVRVEALNGRVDIGYTNEPANERTSFPRCLF